MDFKVATKRPPSSIVANKAAAALLHFAIDLESLASTDKGISLSNLEHYSLRANEPNKFPASSLEQDTAHQLESIGRRIWNIFLHKQNAAMQDDDQICQIQVCLRARLFGYLLLGIGLLGRPNANAAQSATYLIRLGLALCKACINNAELECARIALQRITEYLPCSPCGTAPAESDGSSHADYASYYILRIALSWKDDRLDLAEHMYTKATQHTPFVDAGTRTTLVQILTQIGESFVSKTNITAAVPWLRRAAAEASAPCGFRDTTVVDAKFQTHEQANLVARGGLVRCLTRLNSRESLEEANRIVAEAQVEFGKRRVEVLEMLVMLQTAKGEADDALTDLLEILLS
ncbi:ZIP4 protein [Beauveria brongniartii RCEF 3172]|uniref:Protein ZIP4 homolog n=1 Tax=Beauveria brongniartii RCEF 3172 TaxID=1081107 RepID=A0A167EL00_9HYPO|nr:ZIP4 protein [Beauveria brongniartii RCEF 3172]